MMPSSNQSLHMYTDVASWWHILSRPKDYEGEATFYRQVIDLTSHGTTKTVLELGSGGGNNASFMKAFYEMTLVDRSPAMLKESEKINPECEHIVGDMRDLRLDREFDAVFIHDAIDYMTTPAELKEAMVTAYAHCKADGVVLLVPDHIKETFQESTSHGGHDGNGRAMRYLEWTWDPNPDDTTFFTDYTYMLRGADGQVQTIFDRHVCGLFPMQTWLDTLTEVGFQAYQLPSAIGDEGIGEWVFVGVKPSA